MGAQMLGSQSLTTEGRAVLRSRVSMDCKSNAVFSTTSPIPRGSSRCQSFCWRKKNKAGLIYSIPLPGFCWVNITPLHGGRDPPALHTGLSFKVRAMVCVHPKAPRPPGPQSALCVGEEKALSRQPEDDAPASVQRCLLGEWTLSGS